MCRLFGIIADSPVSIENPILEGIKPFIELSHKHHDGWGIGYLDNYSSGVQSVRVVKSDYPAYRDDHFTELVKQVVSSLAIVHLRDAKYGKVALKNTQPFLARGWMFAHNGSIRNFRKIERELSGFKFYGQTDSERYFYLVLDRIKQTGNPLFGMCSAIHWLNENHFEGAKNFLMSDGKHLYAYRDGRDLFYVVRELPVLPIGHPKDMIDPNGPNPSGSNGTSKTVKMVIVASEVLSDEDWREVPEDYLLFVDENLQITVLPNLESAVTCQA